MAFQDISDGEEGGEPRWVRLVEAIRPLPTNNGGPTVDKIKRVLSILFLFFIGTIFRNCFFPFFPKVNSLFCLLL